MNDKNETLLLKRSENARNEAGYWSQPGGTVEFGETIEDAIKREIREEFDVEVELGECFGHVNHILPEAGQHWVAVGYLARISKGEPRNVESDKHEEIRWSPLDALPEKLTPTTRNSLKGMARLDLL